MELKGTNFTLRDVEHKDAESFVRHLNDDYYQRYLISIPCPYTLKDAYEFIEKCKFAADQKNWVIEAQGEAIGLISINNITDHKANMGYWLAKTHWGQGIMSEAVDIISKYAFDEFKLVKICATVNVENKSSERALIKNDFEKEGTLKKHHYKNGEYIDVDVFAKFSD